MDYPMKSQLIKMFKTDGEMWDYEAVDKLLAANDRKTEYWRQNARFWTIELAGGGLLEETDKALDDGTHFGRGKILVKYKITALGLERVNSMLEE